MAARNVLLVSSEQVKISDFGLARKQKEDADYYKAKRNDTDLPIYWYSPETLEDFKVSTKGDVWSYGVTLWEMFTLGDNPSAYLGGVVRQAQSAQMAFKSVCFQWIFSFRGSGLILKCEIVLVGWHFPNVGS